MAEIDFNKAANGEGLRVEDIVQNPALLAQSFKIVGPVSEGWGLTVDSAKLKHKWEPMVDTVLQKMSPADYLSVHDYYFGEVQPSVFDDPDLGPNHQQYAPEIWEAVKREITDVAIRKFPQYIRFNDNLRGQDSNHNGLAVQLSPEFRLVENLRDAIVQACQEQVSGPSAPALQQG